MRRPASFPPPPLEVWGGIECTVNRVGDNYFDQIARCGHVERIEDLERFAELGIKAIRYPVLWERIAPDSLNDADWSWTDRALECLRELGIKPIVGLVHHGSGPSHTSLLDPAFAEKLSAFASAVANRYPWIDMVTPVNEPLTTARFACLYGHWYPHRRDDCSFVRALIHQLQAVRSAMDAFRAVNPHAQLIQTEDLGKVYSTPSRSYQAAFENERRWLTVDILAGCVHERHPLWRWLVSNGATRAELESFIQRPCEPDVVGVNHYITGERFLDERTALYPPELVGSNGRHTYADVEAVRVLENGVAGHLGLIAEAWQRYHLPLAITEVHLGCTRGEQLRWLNEAWQSALQLRTEGANVRAVAVWSLLGSHDWDSLLTKQNGWYEPGPFDTRSTPPRATALAMMTKCLATTGQFDHPVLDGQGWWRRPARITHPPFRIARTPRSLAHAVRRERPILIVGSRGTLGAAFTRECGERGLACTALPRTALDVTNPNAIDDVLGSIKPWAVINASGYVKVDDAEWDTENCFRINRDGAIALGARCAALGIHYTTFSSDLVFDGRRHHPYVESDETNPLNVYGASKVAAENLLLSLGAPSLIVRTGAFFGPWDVYNFVTTTLRALEAGNPVHAADDQVVSPTYVPDLVDAVLDLVIDGEKGIWHLANGGAISWSQLARRAAEAGGLDSSIVAGVPSRALNQLARRPAYSALGSTRGTLLPSLDDALARYIAAQPRPATVTQTVNA